MLKTTRSYFRVRNLMLLVSALLLSACGSKGGVPPVIKVGTDVEVAAALNPDPSGRPSPLVLVIYQLKSADDFRNKDFFSVFDPKLFESSMSIIPLMLMGTTLSSKVLPVMVVPWPALWASKTPYSPPTLWAKVQFDTVVFEDWSSKVYS